MKVGITGHSKGIGKAINVVLTSNGYDVIGFSRSNGVDIGTEEGRKIVIDSLKDIDIFINNAYHPEGQTELLKIALKEWKGTNKFVINLSSKMVFYPGTGFEDYVTAKKVQNEIIKSTMLSAHPKVLNLLLGAVDTDMAKVWLSPKIDPNVLANFIYNMIKYQNILAVQEVTIDVPDLDWKDIKLCQI
jgi:hypothetical protein